jgi:hypothetical protein
MKKNFNFKYFSIHLFEYHHAQALVIKPHFNLFNIYEFYLRFGYKRNSYYHIKNIGFWCDEDSTAITFFNFTFAIDYKR